MLDAGQTPVAAEAGYWVRAIEHREMFRINLVRHGSREQDRTFFFARPKVR